MSKTKKKPPYAPRPGTAAAKVISLVSRPNGATIAEIQRATKWTPNMFHSFKWDKARRGVVIECVRPARNKAFRYALAQ